jgi:hypothetical protein
MHKASVLIFFACLLCLVVQAQQSFLENSIFPQYDCEQKVVWEMKKVTIVIPNDSTVVWVDAKRFGERFSERGMEVNVKTESKLQESDLDNNLCIMGPITSYSQWNRFGIPVKKTIRGFEIGDFSFEDPLHAFSYTSTTSPVRIAISGNSFNAHKQVEDETVFGFEFVVMKNYVPELICNASHIVDLNTIKKSLYMEIESKYFIFMVSKNLILENGKSNDAEIDKLDNHVEVFVKKMKLNLPEKKIKTYIHATQDEIKYFTFGDLCNDGIRNGYVTNDYVIHSWEWTRENVEHEANHHIFNQQVNESPAIFLSEGVVVWYEYKKNAEMKDIIFQRAIEFADYDLTDVILGKENFFQGDKYYFISAIFTDYLMDTYGLDKFKDLFRYDRQNLLSGFEKAFSKPLSEILKEYKKWLRTKSANQD